MTVLPSPRLVPSPSLIMFASFARLGGGSPMVILASALAASRRSTNVCKVTGMSLFVGAQKLFFMAFCWSLAALLKQPVLPQRESIRCGLFGKGLSWSGRGLLPHVLNLGFFAERAAGRSKIASAHPPILINVCRFIWSPTVFSAHRTSIYQGTTRPSESAGRNPTRGCPDGRLYWGEGGQGACILDCEGFDRSER